MAQAPEVAACAAGESRLFGDRRLVGLGDVGRLNEVIYQQRNAGQVEQKREPDIDFPEKRADG